MSTVTKKDLVQSIAEKKQLNPQLVKDVVQAVLDEIIDQLGQHNRIEFRDFAVFSVRVRPPRTGHNPRTLQKVYVPPKAVVDFKMGKRMKEAVSRLLESEAQPAAQEHAPRPQAAEPVAATEPVAPQATESPASAAPQASEPSQMPDSAPPTQPDSQ